FACCSAVDHGNVLVVIDPGAYVTYVVRRTEVYALAQQQNWTPSYEDTEIAHQLGELTDLVPGLAQLALAPGRGVATQTKDGQVISVGGAGQELALLGKLTEAKHTGDNKL